MLIGTSSETRRRECGVELIPVSAHGLPAHGHQVVDERDAGARSNTAGRAYPAAVARIAGAAEALRYPGHDPLPPV